MNTDKHLNNNKVATKCGRVQKHKLACLFVYITEAAKQKHKMTDFTHCKIKEQRKIATPIVQRNSKDDDKHAHLTPLMYKKKPLF